MCGGLICCFTYLPALLIALVVVLFGCSAFCGAYGCTGLGVIAVACCDLWVGWIRAIAFVFVAACCWFRLQDDVYCLLWFVVRLDASLVILFGCC